MRFRFFLPFVPLVLATGCSTIVHLDRPSGLAVKGRPDGAAIRVDGVVQGHIAAAPVFVPVDGGSGPHVVRVEKDGYAPQEFSVEKTTSDWVWGNAAFAVFPIVAAAGVGIDAACGSWYRLSPDEIEVSLAAAAPRRPEEGRNSPEPPARENDGVVPPPGPNDDDLAPPPVGENAVLPLLP